MVQSVSARGFELAVGLQIAVLVSGFAQHFLEGLRHGLQHGPVLLGSTGYGRGVSARGDFQGAVLQQPRVLPHW